MTLGATSAEGPVVNAELDRLTAEQGVKPLRDETDLASPNDLTESEFAEFYANVRSCRSND